MRQPTSPAATLATPPKRQRFSAEWLRGTLSGLLSDEQIATMAAADDHPWTTVLRKQWATNDAILAALSARFRVRIANLHDVSAEALEAVTEPLARRYQILPLAISDSSVDIATSNPFDLDCERNLAFVLGRSVRTALASPDDIAQRLDELYGAGNRIQELMEDTASDESDTTVADTPDSLAQVNGLEHDRPIVRLVDRIVAKAIQLRSSDIHLEPQEAGVMVRYRIDGVMQSDSLIPRALALPLVARVKIMARLDIADRMRPQDGRARVTVSAGFVDLRISTLPAALGEKVVIRILDTRQTVLALDSLGLAADDVQRIESLLEAREGLVCVTGPTGSGKTTTLYSIVRHIQQRGVNIVTVEDPVEYRLQGIVQVQVNEKTGLTFPAALRSILRQDPDVILIGEIRDRDTAQIAVQAALTGHLVLTTLHTIDAASAIVRLADVGVPGYKTAAALKGVIAQRLIRRLCDVCRAPASDPLPSAVRNHIPFATTLRPVGCKACKNTGFHGRLAVTEILVCDESVERRITAGESTQRIYEAAREAGMHSLWESGVDHVRTGETSVDELLRVLELPASIAAPAAGRRATDTLTLDDPRPPLPMVAERRTPPVSPPVFHGLAFDLLDEHTLSTPHKQTVLVALASADARAALRPILVEHGFVVRESMDGPGALEATDRIRPDAIILDPHLPRLDGLSVLAKLHARSTTSRIPVLVYATTADDDSEIRAFELGATDYLSGSLRPRILVARVHAMMDRGTDRMPAIHVQAHDG